MQQQQKAQSTDARNAPRAPGTACKRNTAPAITTLLTSKANAIDTTRTPVTSASEEAKVASSTNAQSPMTDAATGALMTAAAEATKASDDASAKPPVGDLQTWRGMRTIGTGRGQGWGVEVSVQRKSQRTGAWRRGGGKQRAASRTRSGGGGFN